MLVQVCQHTRATISIQRRQELLIRKHIISSYNDELVAEDTAPIRVRCKQDTKNRQLPCLLE